MAIFKSEKMVRSFKNKNIRFLLIVIPVLLLLISLLLNSETHLRSHFSNFNPYIKTLPIKYQAALNINTSNDSTYFFSVIDENSIRELLIIKLSPSENETLTDFTINLFPSKKIFLANNNFLKLFLSNNATRYNFRGRTYAVFKTSIPIIDIDRIDIEETTTKSKSKWFARIESPFTPLNINISSPKETFFDELSETPNPFLYLMHKLCNHYDIKTFSYEYGLKNNSLVQVSKDLEVLNNTFPRNMLRIKDPIDFWKKINNRNKSLSKLVVFTGDYSHRANTLINNFIQGELELSSVFDLNKLATYNAIVKIFTNSCDEDIFFTFNEGSNLIEPFSNFSNCLGKTSNFLTRPILDNLNYINVYTKKLEELSSIDFTKNFIENDISLYRELALINSYHPKSIFSRDILEINQRIIQKGLNPSSLIISELISMSKHQMLIRINNTSEFPIDVFGLTHRKKKNIAELDFPKRILSLQTDTVSVKIPRSFENLFVSKKKKVVGFNLAKHIYDLNLSYAVVGLIKKYNASIQPYEQVEKVEHDLFRSKELINNHEFIKIDNKNKKITFLKDSIVISSPLVLAKGFTVDLKAGAKINIKDGGKIISYSPFNFRGTKQKPILIFSSDKKGQGILVLSEGRNSKLKHVIFSDLINPKYGGWSVSGALTFYESPVNLENVTIRNNRCEDALNIVRTHFTMTESQITGTQSDAFDGDFVKGSIVNCLFENLGNDAIDVSGSDLYISNVNISNAGDKGLSAGEDSKMTINNVIISNSEIAIAGKDLSIINAKNVKIKNTKLGITAFKKKPEFGSSNVTINGLVMENVETDYLIESSSNMFVDGKKIETSQNVKDRMYGVEFGRSSAETRNSQ